MIMSTFFFIILAISISLAERENNILNCYDADYVTTITQTQNEDLFPFQILSSSNCEFLLIRNPPSIISFYSVSDQTIIHKWIVNDNTIWSIYPSNDHQQITVSNHGCLSWSTASKSVISTQHPLNSQPQSYALSAGLSNVLDLQIVWLPIVVCIIGAFSVIFCLILYKIFNKQWIKNNWKQRMFMDELPNNSIDENSISCDINMTNIQNDSSIDMNDLSKQNFISIEHKLCSREINAISLDNLVPIAISTPDPSSLMEETSDLCLDPDLITFRPQLEDIISQENMTYNYDRNIET